MEVNNLQTRMIYTNGDSFKMPFTAYFILEMENEHKSTHWRIWYCQTSTSKEDLRVSRMLRNEINHLC